MHPFLAELSGTRADVHLPKVTSNKEALDETKSIYSNIAGSTTHGFELLVTVQDCAISREGQAPVPEGHLL